MPKHKQIDITSEIERIVYEYYKQTQYIVRDVIVSPFYDADGKLTQFYVHIEGEYE